MAPNLHALLLALELTLVMAMCFASGPKDLDYCDKRLCNHTEERHIACKTYMEFHSDCGQNAVVLKMSKAIRNVILSQHNKLRDLMAFGFGDFALAGRMATMRWNPELAFLAELNTRECNLRRTACLTTTKYMHTGRNLAYNKFEEKQNDMEIVRSQIEMWFYESMHADGGSILNGKPKEKNGESIRHFLQVVRDRADRVGCAIVRDEDGAGWTKQHMTCVYNMGVDECYPIYEAAKVAGKACKTGLSKKYEFLCSDQEVYDYKECGGPIEPEVTTKRPTTTHESIVTDPDLSTDEPDEDELDEDNDKNKLSHNILKWMSDQVKQFNDNKPTKRNRIRHNHKHMH